MRQCPVGGLPPALHDAEQIQAGQGRKGQRHERPKPRLISEEPAPISLRRVPRMAELPVLHSCVDLPSRLLVQTA
jgi:hypothetical protein